MSADAGCELFPAVDLLDGQVVRLAQGDYNRSTVYGSDPSAVAESFLHAGARWIHVVDLNGARGSGPVNRPVIGRLAAMAAAAGAQLQTGGGIRTVDDASALFDAGVARVVVGTAAVRNPDVVSDIVALQRGQVAVGLDAHSKPGGRWEVAVQGWTESTGLDLLDVLDAALDRGAHAVVATDISRDGMLTGPSLALYDALLQFKSARTDAGAGFDVVSSGGVAGLDDVIALAGLPGMSGVIAGRAIYEGLLDVDAAVRACRQQRSRRSGPGAT